jgi:glycosyltransferase involved in cell wall biosynthesis
VASGAAAIEGEARAEPGRPLRVLVVGPHPPPTGGIATVVRNLLALRFRAPIETRLFDVAVPLPAGAAFRVLQAASARLGPFALWGASVWWLLAAFRRRLAAERPDLVHVHTSSGDHFWASSLLVRAARRRGVPALLHLHASSMDEFHAGLGPLERVLFARFLRSATLCIALSERWGRWYARFVPPERLAVLPNCIEWKKFQLARAPRSQRRPQVLFVGLMYARRKGAHDVIAAAATVVAERPDVEFVLVGSDDEGVEAGLEVDAATRRALRFTGDLPPEAVRAAYHEASVFVLPSYREGMPMVMLEAMAAGLPVVCGNVNAIPEVVRDGVTGFLVEPGDREALARRILELLRDPALRERIGEAARAFIREHHDLSVQAERLEALYLRAAGRRP